MIQLFEKEFKFENVWQNIYVILTRIWNFSRILKQIILEICLVNRLVKYIRNVGYLNYFHIHASYNQGSGVLNDQTIKTIFYYTIFFKFMIVTVSPHFVFTYSSNSIERNNTEKIEAFFGRTINRSTYKNIYKCNLFVHLQE